MVKKFLSVTLLGLLLVACKESNTEAEQQTQNTTIQVEQKTTSPTPVESDSTTIQVERQAQPSAQPANAGPFIQPQQNQQTTPTTGQTAPGWSGKPNPPHGQPGHRCDIQVGAILP